MTAVRTTEETAKDMQAVGHGIPEPKVAATAPVVPGRSWVIATSSGYAATGYLPGWAEGDPSESGVTLERVGVKLADMCHRAPFRWPVDAGLV